MIFVLSMGVALGLVLLELAAGLVGEQVRRSIHLAFVFVFVILVVLPSVQRVIDGTDLVIIGIALLIGFFFSVLYGQCQVIRLFVSVLLPAVLAFPLWFLLMTAVGRLVIPETFAAQADIDYQPSPGGANRAG